MSGRKKPAPHPVDSRLSRARGSSATGEGEPCSIHGGRVAALGEANLPIFSHFFSTIGFARFASDGVAAESVSAERCTERFGGRAMLKQNCKSSFLSRDLAAKPQRPGPFYYGRAPTVHEMDWIHIWDWIERVPVIVRCTRCDRDVYGRLPAPRLVPASSP
jgi:hypothetical protein